MATSALESFLHHLRSLLRQDEGRLTDGELVELFVARRDAAAFEALMRRHGPMVLGVCRRVLRNEADAEDAFQATFLVLVRKAASIRPRGMVGNFLYGVAHSTALKARAMSSKRLAKERAAAARPRPESSAETGERLHALVDQELKGLPDIYRSAIVLCDLEGKSIKEAARHLDCPPGTVGTRLARGRTLLARRLSRHGLPLSGGMIAAALAQDAAGAVPPLLLHATIRAAVGGVVSAEVMTLTEGVLTSMLLAKLKIATACGLVVCLLAGGAGLSCYQALAATTPEPTTVPRASAERAGNAPTPDSRQPSEEPAQPAPADGILRGSGKLDLKAFDLADFTTIEVNPSFEVALKRADGFYVAITADDNLLPHVQAVVVGSKLRLSIDPEVKSISATALKAVIHLPVLEGVRAASGSRVTMKGFKSAKPFQAHLAFTSSLEGDIEAPTVVLDVAGGSRATLSGSAKDLKLTASQVCRLSLADLTVERANVTLKDGSIATVNVRDRLEYDLNRASRLEYLGKPIITKGITLDVSSAGPALEGKER